MYSSKGKVDGILEVIPFHQLILEAVLAYGENGSIDVYKDATLTFRDGGGRKIIRAMEKYDQFGAFFDWVSVSWPVNGRHCPVPAKVVLIYVDRNGEHCAIGHCCEFQDDAEIALGTPISQRWTLEFQIKQPTVPALRKFKLSEIIEVLYVVEHVGNKALPFDARQATLPGIEEVFEPRYTWSSAFLNTKWKHPKH